VILVFKNKKNQSEKKNCQKLLFGQPLKMKINSQLRSKNIKRQFISQRDNDQGANVRNGQHNEPGFKKCKNPCFFFISII